MLVPVVRARRRHPSRRRRLRRSRPASRRAEPRSPIGCRTPRSATSTFWKRIERDLTDHLARSRSLELPVNTALKLYGRPGETPEAFAARCAQVADERADAEVAKLRDKYEAKAATLRDRIAAAEDSADVAAEQQKARERDDLLSTAGSVLGGLLGGRSSRGGLLGQLGRAIGKRGKTSAAEERVEAAENKVGRLAEDLAEIETELAEELTEIDSRWADHRPAGSPRRRQPGAHRRQGHQPGPGLDPGPLTRVPDVNRVSQTLKSAASYSDAGRCSVSAEVVAFAGCTRCGRGGTGRRAGFRSQFRKE